MSGCLVSYTVPYSPIPPAGEPHGASLHGHFQAQELAGLLPGGLWGLGEGVCLHPSPYTPALADSPPFPFTFPILSVAQAVLS